MAADVLAASARGAMPGRSASVAVTGCFDYFFFGDVRVAGTGIGVQHPFFAHDFPLDLFVTGMGGRIGRRSIVGIIGVKVEASVGCGRGFAIVLSARA